MVCIRFWRFFDCTYTDSHNALETKEKVVISDDLPELVEEVLHGTD